MGKMKELLLQAKLDYKNLENFVKSYDKTFDELYKELNGFLLVKNICFKANYGCITAIVVNCYGVLTILKVVDIWDSQNCEIIHKSFEMEEIANV